MLRNLELNFWDYKYKKQSINYLKSNIRLEDLLYRNIGDSSS